VETFWSSTNGRREDIPKWWRGMKMVSANERVALQDDVAGSNGGWGTGLATEIGSRESLNFFNIFPLRYHYEIVRPICLFRDVSYEVKIKLLNKTELSCWWFLYHVYQDTNVFHPNNFNLQIPPKFFFFFFFSLFFFSPFSSSRPLIMPYFLISSFFYLPLIATHAEFSSTLVTFKLVCFYPDAWVYIVMVYSFNKIMTTCIIPEKWSICRRKKY